MFSYLRTDDMEHPNSKWITEQFSILSPKNFNFLLNGDIPGIIIKEFVSAAVCGQIVKAIVGAGLQNYQHVAANVGKFGLVQMEYNTPERKSEYFANVDPVLAEYKAALEGLPQPAESVMRQITKTTGFECLVPNESGLGKYFTGTFRHVKGEGRTHFDHAKVETSGWAISEVEKQLSWNIYLSDPGSGGELVVYETQWTPKSEVHKSEEYWYHDSVLSSARSVIYRPRVGDLVIFNSRNFHEIKKPLSDRFTVSSFIGLLPSGQLLFWS